MDFKKLLFCLTAPLAVSGLALQRRSACSGYTIIDTRGTGEAQGPSAGFRTMNANILSQVAGGKEYDTVYPAAQNQNIGPGVQDIVDHIHNTLASNPNECFILEGYSQGAAATVQALPSITGAAFNAVIGVFLIGNPAHKAGLACNVDNNGGSSTDNVNGVSEPFQTIPSNWVHKILDVCAYADGVCDTTHGSGITKEHLVYPGDASTQNMGTKFVVDLLKSGSGTAASVPKASPSATKTQHSATPTKTATPTKSASPSKSATPAKSAPPSWTTIWPWSLFAPHKSG